MKIKNATTIWVVLMVGKADEEEPTESIRLAPGQEKEITIYDRIVINEV